MRLTLPRASHAGRTRKPGMGAPRAGVRAPQRRHHHACRVEMPRPVSRPRRLRLLPAPVQIVLRDNGCFMRGLPALASGKNRAPKNLKNSNLAHRRLHHVRACIISGDGGDLGAGGIERDRNSSTVYNFRICQMRYSTRAFASDFGEAIACFRRPASRLRAPAL